MLHHLFQPDLSTKEQGEGCPHVQQLVTRRRSPQMPDYSFNLVRRGWHLVSSIIIAAVLWTGKAQVDPENPFKAVSMLACLLYCGLIVCSLIACFPDPLHHPRWFVRALEYIYMYGLCYPATIVFHQLPEVSPQRLDNFSFQLFLLYLTVLFRHPLNTTILMLPVTVGIMFNSAYLSYLCASATTQQECLAPSWIHMLHCLPWATVKIVTALASTVVLHVAFNPVRCTPPNSPSRIRPSAQLSVKHMAETIYKAAVQAEEYIYYTIKSLNFSLVILITCSPIVAYTFVLCWVNYILNLVNPGAPERRFLPLPQVSFALCAAVILGGVNVAPILRRLHRSQVLLHDLLPAHIAEALLESKSSQHPSRKSSTAGATPPPPPNATLRWSVAGSSLRGFFDRPFRIMRAISASGHSLDSQPAPLPPPRSISGTPILGRVHGPLQHWQEQELKSMSLIGSPPDKQLYNSLMSIEEPERLLSNGNISLPGFGPEAGRESMDGQVQTSLAEWHESVSVLFADICGFTTLAQQVEAQTVMQVLNSLYMRFDTLCTRMPVYKVETIGDCYVAATGLLHDDPDHAASMLQFALALQREAAQVLSPADGQPIQMRIGIHSGRVMSGIVGYIRRRYCLFGDTVNTASRMETMGAPNAIHISCSTYELLQQSEVGTQMMESCEVTCRGEIEVKGKGSMVTYWLQPPAEGSQN